LACVVGSSNLGPDPAPAEGTADAILRGPPQEAVKYSPLNVSSLSYAMAHRMGYPGLYMGYVAPASSAGRPAAEAAEASPGMFLDPVSFDGLLEPSPESAEAPHGGPTGYMPPCSPMRSIKDAIEAAS
jgi:hypothetical protein